MQIIVLGMHRSGTSALARIVNLMGCYYGSEEASMVTAPDNPKGFWERKDVMAANDLILDVAGGNWWEVYDLDIQKISEADRSLIDTEIRDIIFRLDSHRPWFIKDPRLCLTLPFWCHHLEKAVFILVLRSPFSAAKSLEERNGIPMKYGLALWEYYMRALCVHLVGIHYLSVRYESILKRPYETTKDVHRWLTDNGVNGLQSPSRNEIEAFVDPKLCHHDAEDRALQTDGPVTSLFDALCAGQPVPNDASRMKVLAQQMRQLQKNGKWVIKIPKVERFSTSMRRLADLESKSKTLEEENRRIEKEAQELARRNDDLFKENNRLTKETQRLRGERGRLQDELHQLEGHHEELWKKFNGITSEHNEYKTRLNAISHSRIVRVIAKLTRFLGLGQSGIHAELKRIDCLLVPPEHRYHGRRIQKSDVELLLRIFRLFLMNPNQALGLINPGRIRRTLDFLLMSKGNLALFANRCEEVHFRDPNQPFGTIHDPAISLIDLYDLPRFSHSKRPPLPRQNEIVCWKNGLKKVAQTIKQTQEPNISIIIPVYNQIRYTLACIHSIYLDGQDGIDYEIIVSDDRSTDATQDVFTEPFANVIYRRNKKNLGFLRNCNEAATIAKGNYLVFLNNDTIVLSGWLTELIRTLENDPEIGLVGSKLIYPEGRLQEAGGIVFEDGSGWNFGRFEDPFEPMYDHARDVDYCSGASIAIPAALWKLIGGFDERYSPAYYEDTDLSFQVRAAHRRVVYQPKSQLVHFEGTTCGTRENEGVKRYQVVNRYQFLEKWRQELSSHGSCNPPTLPYLRGIKGRILFIDATTPRPNKDSGSIDAVNYMKIFKNLGFHITFVTLDVTAFEGYTTDLQRLGVECVHLPWIESTQEAIRQYGPKADLIILCRVQVAAPLIDIVKKHAGKAKIVFDTVDLHFLRESRQAALCLSPRMDEKAAKTREDELDVIKKADATMCRSYYEIQVINDILPHARTYHIPVARDLPEPTRRPWDELKDIVFIGGFSHPPNIDAVVYFISDVWPILRRQGFSGKFIVAGSDMPSEIEALSEDNVIIRGYVPDLSELFGACRLSVAPLRYGAGMKGKVVTSLSYGIPCVATEIAVEGTGLCHDENILVAKDADDMASLIQDLYGNQERWQSLSSAGIQFCQREISIEAVNEKLYQLTNELLG